MKKFNGWSIASFIVIIVSTAMMTGCGGGAGAPPSPDSNTTMSGDDNTTTEVDPRIAMVNSFFDIELGDKKSWYWVGSDDDGYWQTTNIDCQYQLTDDGEYDATQLTPDLNLRSHYTVISELDCNDDGDSCLLVINCSLDNNYDLGEGFASYNDQQIAAIFSDRIELGAVADYNNDGLKVAAEGWGWIKTPGEVLERALFAQNW